MLTYVDKKYLQQPA